MRAAGINWSLLHLNEGHSAFATIEFTRVRMEATQKDGFSGTLGPYDNPNHSIIRLHRKIAPLGSVEFYE